MITTTNIFSKKIQSIFAGITSPKIPLNAKYLGQYSKLNTYQNIFEINKIKRTIHTQVPIQHSNPITFGTTPKTAQENMSSIPQMAMFNTHGLNRKILLFNDQFESENIQIEMHFHKNELFYFKILFPEASQELRIRIMKSLIAKYQIENVDLTLYSVFDNHNNCIQIRDLATFEIHFTHMGSPFFNTLVKVITNSNNQLLADYQLTSASLINTAI